MAEAKKVEDRVGMPRKRDYRTRAHRNPLSDTMFAFPLTPRHVDWNAQFEGVLANTFKYPMSFDTQRPESDRRVTMVDIGCGYGGLCFALSEMYTDAWILGLEIRDKVVNYVADKIRAMRKEGKYNRTSVMMSNAMKQLPNFFEKHQLEKIFICFADPHFKKSNHRRRIINRSLVSEYAYLLAPGGRIYSITDVKALHDWNHEHLTACDQFREIPDPESDPCLEMMKTATEESQKVTRNQGMMFYCIFERVIS